jgi:hypothetical protein
LCYSSIVAQGFIPELNRNPVFFRYLSEEAREGLVENLKTKRAAATVLQDLIAQVTDTADMLLCV